MSHYSSISVDQPLRVNLKLLISQGKESYVANFLAHHLSRSQTETNNELVMFLASLNRLKHENQNGLIARDAYEIAYNRLIHNLLKLIDELKLEQQDFGSQDLINFYQIDKTPPSVPESIVGEVLDTYMIRAYINRGGFGSVYKALDLNKGQEVALKISHPLNMSEFYLNHIISLSQKALKIPPHPHIVQIYEVGYTQFKGNTVLYQVMRLAEGGDLHQLIHAGNTLLSTPAKFQLMLGICNGLSFAHQLVLEGVFGNKELGIIHGDLKPTNILLDAQQRPLLADFLSVDFYLIEKEDIQIHNSLLDRDPTTVIGTMNYMAPEQMANGTLNEQTDIFSLGLLFFELMTGQKPGMFMQEQFVLDSFRALEQTDHDMNLGIAHMINRCIKLIPAERYASVDEIIQDLQALHTP